MCGVSRVWGASSLILLDCVDNPQAILIVSDSKQSYTLTGNGDVIEPHDGIIGIGSGGTYALGKTRSSVSGAYA